jgi:hypothetical protein
MKTLKMTAIAGDYIQQELLQLSEEPGFKLLALQVQEWYIPDDAWHGGKLMRPISWLVVYKSEGVE